MMNRFTVVLFVVFALAYGEVFNKVRVNRRKRLAPALSPVYPYPQQQQPNQQNWPGRVANPYQQQPYAYQPQQQYPGQMPYGNQPQQQYPSQIPFGNHPQQQYPGQNPYPGQQFPGQSPYPRQNPYGSQQQQYPSPYNPYIGYNPYGQQQQPNPWGMQQPGGAPTPNQDRCTGELLKCLEKEAPEYGVAFTSIDNNPQLTKGEVMEHKQRLIRRLSDETQRCYKEARATERKCHLEEKREIKRQVDALSSSARNAYRKIKDIETNNKLTKKEECEQVSKMLNTMNPQLRNEIFAKLPSMRQKYGYFGQQQQPMNYAPYGAAPGMNPVGAPIGSQQVMHQY